MGQELKIGWIGLGNMGQPMSTRLLEAGYQVTVYNRNAAKAADVVKAGAKLVKSPKEAATGADVVFTMIADNAALEAVTLGADGAVAGLKPGAILVDMSTVEPVGSSKVNAAVEAAGGKFLRAPVTGSTVLAKAGTIGILASGDKTAYEKALELFKILGKAQFYLGGGEEARYMKIALNMMIGTSMQMFAESLVLGTKAGLNRQQMIEVICGSVVGSPFIQYKAKPLAEGNYAPAFSTRLMEKDFDLALGMAKKDGVPLPVTAIVRQMLSAAHNTGKADMDFSAVTMLLEELAGMKSAKAGA
jgi:3-hydroxyisobutyrate dehydrogenase-like beta-hydroxyacid dehydrogenase